MSFPDYDLVCDMYKLSQESVKVDSQKVEIAANFFDEISTQELVKRCDSQEKSQKQTQNDTSQKLLESYSQIDNVNYTPELEPLYQGKKVCQPQSNLEWNQSSKENVTVNKHCVIVPYKVITHDVNSNLPQREKIYSNISSKGSPNLSNNSSYHFTSNKTCSKLSQYDKNSQANFTAVKNKRLLDYVHSSNNIACDSAIPSYFTVYKPIHNHNITTNTNDSNKRIRTSSISSTCISSCSINGSEDSLLDELGNFSSKIPERKTIPTNRKPKRKCEHKDDQVLKSKRERNAEAAQRYRDKRKEEREMISCQVSNLERMINKNKSEIKILENEILKYQPNLKVFLASASKYTETYELANTIYLNHFA